MRLPTWIILSKNGVPECALGPFLCAEHARDALKLLKPPSGSTFGLSSRAPKAPCDTAEDFYELVARKLAEEEK
jgi:hypothetical protein